MQKNINTTSKATYIGISLGITCACSASFIAILVKQLTIAKVHYSISMLYACYIGLPFAIAISLGMYFAELRNIDPSVYDTHENLKWQVFYILGSALCGCLFQSLSVIANRYESASKLAIVSTSNLFWSFLLQYFVLNIGTNFFSMTGALLIIFSVISSIIAKMIGERLNKESLKSNENQSNFCLNIFKKCLLFKF